MLRSREEEAGVDRERCQGRGITSQPGQPGRKMSRPWAVRTPGYQLGLGSQRRDVGTRSDEFRVLVVFCGGLENDSEL